MKKLDRPCFPFYSQNPITRCGDNCHSRQWFTCQWGMKHPDYAECVKGETPQFKFGDMVEILVEIRNGTSKRAILAD